MQVLPNVSQLERCEALSNDLLKTSPAPDARTAYVRALAVQLLGCAISGARARGQACLDFIDKLGPEERERDVVARGYVRLWRSIFTFIVGNDMPRALSLVEQAIRDLTESQVMYRLSLAYTVQSFTWWGLGDWEKSESSARRGMAIAEDIHDDYHTAVAAWYLGLTLAEQPDPAKLDEAIHCAGAMSRLQESALFDATSRNVIARAALTKKDWLRAEHEARISREGLISIPPYRLFATATLLDTLVHADRGDEAAAIAREDLALLTRIGSPVCSEVQFRVAAAEALYLGGAREEAQRALRDALAQIELRAGTLSDPTMKARFLQGRPENRRAAELTATWLGAPA